MEAVYRVACCGLAFALALTLSATSGEAESLRRSLWARSCAERLLRAVGSLGLARRVGASRGIRVLATSWGRMAQDSLGLELGFDGGLGLVLAFVLASGVAGLAVALSPLGLVAGVACGAMVVALRGETLRRSRERTLEQEMPAAFRSLASSLAAGRTLSQAMAGLGERGHGPVSEAFSRAALRLSCGFSAQEALDLLADELDAPGTSLITCALSVSHRTGSPLKGLFERSAALLERRQELERTLAVKTAQVRLSVRVVCLLPAVMLLVLTLISPDYRTGLVTSTGTACVAIAIALDAAAVMVIRKLMKGVM